MDLESIDGLLEEINYLKNRSNLLKEILNYYDRETMAFDIPTKWKDGTRISDEAKKNCPKSPRHFLMKKMYECLDYEEQVGLINYEELGKTMI